MRRIDSLIHAGWIIPVEPAGAVLRDHAIAVHEGRIIDVLPSVSAERVFHPSVRYQLARHAVLPGLVNAHTHAAMTLFRGLADDLPLMEWLNDHIWPAESRWVSERFVEDGTRLAVAEMLRGGTTCFNDMYFFANCTARVAAEVGMRAVVGLIVIDFPTVWARDADEYLAKGVEIHDHYRDSPLIRTAFAPHAPYTVADAALTRVSALAEELDLPIHMHVHETTSEISQSLARYGERPLARLDRLGLLTPRLVAVHMTQLEEAEIGWFAASGAHVVHCPESNLKLASGSCRVAQLAQAQVNVALGTDSAASNDDLDMLAETRTCALLAKGVSASASAIPAGEALRMATLNGARALGVDNEIGSLVPGKAADIAAVDLDTLETQPLYNPLSQIVYAAARHQVTHVWVAGKLLLRERALVTLDEEALMARVRQWGARIGGDGISAHSPVRHTNREHTREPQ